MRMPIESIAPSARRPRVASARSPRLRARLAALAVIALLPIAAHAAPAGEPGPVVGTVLYDNLGNPVNDYYAGQGGNEAIDDLHLVSGGSLDELRFECYDPAPGGTFTATITIYGNPSGLDLAASPVLGTYTVAGIGVGRQLVSVSLADAPAVSAHLWVGIQFSSTTAGLVRKSVPAIGTSHDTYLENDDFFDFGGSPLANFAIQLVDIPSYGLDVSITGQGSVARAPDLASYLAGTIVQLTPTPSAHWHFVGWGGDASGASVPLTVTMDAARSVTATFAIDTYTLSYSAGPNGTLTGTTPQVVEHGADGAPVTAVPSSGYRFVRWSDGVLTATRTELGVTASLAVTAFFDVLDLACNGGFESDLAGWSRYGNGSLLRVEPGRSSGWSLRIRSSSSSDVGIDDSPNCIQGTRAGDRYRFSVWAKAVTTSSLNRPLKLRIYEYDGSSRVDSYASAGLKLTADWTRLSLDYVVRRSGTSLSERILFDPSGSGQSILIDDVMIEPLPPPVAFTIQASAGPGGSIAPAGAVSVNQGDSRSFAITPSAGYRIEDVVVDGSSVGAVAAYTFPNVQGDHSIVASFSAIPPGENLVADPSFESGISGWTDYGDAVLSWSSLDAHSGARSLQVAGEDASFGIDDKPNWVARVAGAGARYRFQAWVKRANASSTGKVKIRVYEYDGSSQVGSTVYSPEIVLPSSWQLLTAEHTVQRANTSLSMRVTTSSDDQTFFVDDVSIEMVAPPTGAALRSTASEEAVLEFERPIVYPNPARGGAVLALSLAKPGKLEVHLYDVSGRLVRVLAQDADAAAGTHRLALEGERGTQLGAGLYFYRARVEGREHRGRFVMLD